MKKNIFRIMAIIAMTGFFLISCGRGGKDADTGKNAAGTGSARQMKLKVVAINMQDVNVLLRVVEAKEYFKKRGVDVEIVRVEKGSDKLLMQNVVDAKIGSISNALSMYMNDQDPVMIDSLFELFVSGFSSRFPTLDKQDVINVGIDRMGNDGHYSTLVGLKNYGVDLTKIRIVAIPDEKARYALAAKKELDVFATNTFNPKLSGSFSGLTHYPRNNKGYYFPRAILTSKKTYDTKKPELKAFLEALKDGTDFLVNNKEESIRVISETLELNAADAEVFYGSFVKAIKDGKSNFSMESILNVSKLVADEVKPKNPNRDLKDFVRMDLQ